MVRKKFSRKQLLAYTANLQPSLIGLEACSGAHFIGTALRNQGREVRLIPAQFVKPFLKSNKNDFLDAEAIAEAVARQNMRFVAIKTDDQLDLQALHRVRDRLVHRRTAVINQIRGFLLERGLTFGFGDDRAMQEVETAFEKTIQSAWSTHGICHGAFGNLEFLSLAAERMHRSDWDARVKKYTTVLLNDVSRRGFVHDSHSETLNLMLGLAGIGQSLIRLLNPTEIRSVLLLE